MSEIVIKVEIPGLEKLIYALEAIAGKSGTSVVPSAALPVLVQPPIPQYQAQTQTQPIQQIPQAQQQMQQPMQQQPMQVPTTAVAQDFTQDQLAVAAAGLVNQGKQPRLMQMLAGFGANSLVEIPKERYGEFAIALRAEGAVI